MKYIICALICFVSIKVNAQRIQGKIVDAEKNPLEYASVRLMNTIDSTVISGAYTDVDGNFVIDNVAQAVYFIRISYANLETRDVNADLLNQSNLQLGTIELELDQTIDLDEVTAAGSLDVLKAGIDKKVYSVADDLTSKGGNVSDILNNIP